MGECMQTYFPGEIVVDEGFESSHCCVVKSGMGTQACVATKAAVVLPSPLGASKTQMWTINKRYTPRDGDLVLGIVTVRTSEYYKVDINSASDALLPTLSFNGATKRYCPRVEVGGRVYCIVVSTTDTNDCELSCISTTDSKSWSSQEAYLGHLTDGYVVSVSVALAASLAGESCCVLERLGSSWKFEVAIGLNGRVWISSSSVRQTLAIGQLLQALSRLDADKIDTPHLAALVKYIVRRSTEDCLSD
eukprot:CAMPEP_0113846690 /NCGR_PEP_ID=MMETSP0372-20130328/1450_1 /TAXON_ID=340204 /ORGANISM="Lankesteria abbotti" /LENGTH=247 /DNA_ID=CAMNT_0000815867 /DNA_START=10 /DNA_END=753 /DNA_ORIENTATION=+ /assembly_acc=CAM_ASM_000359